MTRNAGHGGDILTGVGLTALTVCAARALDSKLHHPLANDDYAARFVAAANEPNLAAAVANCDMTSAAGVNAQWVGVRTRFFDDFFTDAGAAGIRQSVILAAGLDSRAYRLGWPPDSQVFEIDQPRVLEFKQQVFDQLRAVPNARRVAVQADLRANWAGALKDAGFDQAQPTAWALEGLLPYLSGIHQDALFQTLHELSSSGSQMATELGPNPGEVAEFAQGASVIKGLHSQPSALDLWYDDPRLDTKQWLREHDWSVIGVDLVNVAANTYGRVLHGLPTIFNRILRTKFFTAHYTG